MSVIFNRLTRLAVQEYFIKYNSVLSVLNHFYALFQQANVVVVHGYLHKINSILFNIDK
jgi:hypothetical protein